MVVLIRQASESGQLYGSVTSRDIAKSISEAGYKVSRKQVILNKTIKQIGIYRIDLLLHPEVKIIVDINVARTEEEASIQNKNDKQEKKSSPQKPDNEELSVSEEFFENQELAENAKINMSDEKNSDSSDNPLTTNQESENIEE